MITNTVPKGGELKLLNEYFETLHRTTDPIRINAFHELRKGKPEEIIGPLEKVIRKAAEWNKQGYGIYSPIQEIPADKKRNDGNVEAINTLFMDFDKTPVGPALERLKKAGIPANMIYETSRGKHHVYLLVEDCPLAEYKPIQQWLAKEFGSDPAVSDPCRVARVPASFNMKDPDNKFRVRLVGEVNPRRYKLAHIKKALGIELGSREVRASLDVPLEPRAQATTTPKTFEEFCDQKRPSRPVLEKCEIILSQLNPDLPENEWHKVITIFHYESQGDVEVFKLVDEWSQEGSKYDASNSVESHWNRCELSPGDPATFGTLYKWIKEGKNTRPIKSDSERPGGVEGSEGSAPLYVDSTALKVQPPEFMIDEFIENNTTGVIFGETGTYKSFLSLDLAFCVATGNPWKGRDVKQGNVFYLAGEGFGGLARRKAAWEVENKVELEEGQIHFSRCAIDVLDKKSVEHVKNETDKLVATYGKPGFIVLDTLAANFGPGDENSSEAMMTFLRHINRYLREPYGCTVMIIHHTGHNNGGRGRGSSALRAGIDFEFGVAEDPKDKRVIEIFSTKTKDAERPANMWLMYKKVRVGWDEIKFQEINSLVLVETTKPVGVKRPDGMTGNLLDLAESLMDSDQKVDRGRLKLEALKRTITENTKQFLNALLKLKNKFWLDYETGDEQILVLNGQPKTAQTISKKMDVEEDMQKNG